MFSGHLQLDNCLFEQGQVHVNAPATVNIRYCTFNSSHVSFKGTGFSNVSNCKFKPDRVAVAVEEPSLSLKTRMLHPYVGGWVEMVQSANLKEYYNRKVRYRNSKAKMYSENVMGVSASAESFESSEKSSGTLRDTENENETSRGKRGEPGYSDMNIDSNYDCFDDETKGILNSVRGIIFTNNKIEGGRGGVTVSRLGHAWIEGNVFSGLVYGIRCMQSARAVILANTISNCETSAIFMREHSNGLVCGNQIFSNGEAGIDLRSNANPVIQNNHIFTGKRSGIVCLDNGRGIIRDNDIYNNKEAGVYILYKGNPDVM